MHTKQITYIFQVFEAILLTTIFGLFIYGFFSQDLLLFSYQLGLKFGTLAVFTLTATLTPGILKRLGTIRPLMILLSPHKRHMGITTYFFAIGHYLLVTLLPSIATNSFPPTVTQITIFGFLGLLTMTPLFITSNDFSMKKLGRNWGRLHKLVYLSGIFILIHTALQSNNIAFVATLVLVLEVASYIKLWFFKPKPSPAQPNNS